MGQRSDWVLSAGLSAKGGCLDLRSRLAVTTILAVVPFLGYGRQAYADCIAGTSPAFTCSGTTVTTQTINTPDADVSTAPGFNLTAPTGDGVHIEADGHLQFNDVNASPITATNGTGLFVYSTGNSADNAGAITIVTDGDISGGDGDGIHAYSVSQSGGPLTIAAGPGGAITGSDDGIEARNLSGDLTIMANGVVTGETDDGINAFNAGIYDPTGNGRDLTITTGAQSVITGYDDGIYARNNGTGNLVITADGEVTGNGLGPSAGYGIFAFNSRNGGDLRVTTGVDSVVYGASGGIDVENNAESDLILEINGQVTSNDTAIDATNDEGFDLTITTGAQSVIRGGTDGITAGNRGAGYTEITIQGQVIGEDGDGMELRGASSTRDFTVITGAQSTVTGSENGIDAYNNGAGDLSVTINGELAGESEDGLYAANNTYFGSGNARNLTISTGAQSDVSGGDDGIEARNRGEGDLTITVDGDVTGVDGDGIFAANDYYFDNYSQVGTGFGHNLTITVGAQSVVAGDDEGIDARNRGDGDLAIIVNGTVTGARINGISATNSGLDATIETAAGSVVRARQRGIDIDQRGTGTLNILVDGEATGENEYGIYSNNFDGIETIIRVGSTGLAQGARGGIYAYSGDGQNIAITNDGVVRNLSGSSSDQAIRTRLGPATVNNDNLLIGTVWLGDLEDTLNNSGLWNSANGFSEFGGGYDVVNNSGTLRAADDPALSEEMMLSNAELVNNSGLMTLVDGVAGDALQMGGATEYVGLNGRLAVDAFLDPAGTSDRLTIAGSSGGVTSLVVNLTNPLGSTPNFVGIPVITVTDGTAEADFNVEGGVLNAGFFAWDLQLDGNTHELITVGLGAGSYEFAAGITGAQDIWHQTTGTLLQRQADLRALLAGTQVTPVADFSEPVEPTPVGRVTPGLWLKGVGAYLERDQDEANNVSTDRSQEIYGFMAGFDFGSESAGEAWMFGLFGGYVMSDLDFDQSGSEWHYEGPSVGAYATYVDHAFYADLTVKADFLDVDIDDGDIAPDADDVDTDVVNLGGLIDAGYKMPLNHGLFAEPQASLAVVHTEIDDIDDVMGGSVDFEDETSIRGRLGLRLGHELTASNQLIYSSDVTASVWQEFAGDNDVTIAAPGFPVSDVSDSPSETYGDVALGFSVQSPEGWSSFLRANYQFAEDYDAFAGNAGVRFAW
ncbi:autotransporter outer membrane beta-barrel domain-containing protein [Taklimakanibacter lacteus]|uniref:autotransporter outer membrane beta-barrel domain-containing protein n=1 Tax=Taklimakanibacter lacteus TaxID=2268456 RepID=UPI000E673958